MEKYTSEVEKFLEVTHGRRSVRKFDPTVQMSDQELKELIYEATLAPSGGNLQPTRYFVIKNTEAKQKLYEIAYNQEQVKAASAVIVILSDMNFYKNAEEIFGSAVEKGYLTEELKNQFIQRYTTMIENMPIQDVREGITYDTGLASMQLMLVARAKGYDTNPMSGFDKERFIKEFGIEEQYIPVALIPVGKALHQPGHPTTRLSVEKVTTIL
ncbi:nitroreductase family protein [Priestia aryabhattai]|uniref:nitroreductase family protein n=1 Tax=Priestia aryabhattai TaxID=412384 RepID=UPI0023801141|nr:nitroreductase family protein [Priestia aryabhattai]WDW11381.1 nitroreductase family protein [Priestia aryabhattai]